MSSLGQGINSGPLFTGVATDIVSVTPSDTVDLPIPVRAFYINTTGGTITLITLAGTTSPAINVVQGQLLPIGATRVKATGTTAVGIIGLL